MAKHLVTETIKETPWCDSWLTADEAKASRNSER
jgi:hypothetical protein